MTTTYTLLGETPETQLTITELKQQLESTSETIKIQTMKRLLHQMLNGDSLDSILMHVIRFIMPSKNKILKKLLLLFWELVSKLDSNGILKQEMILMCSHLRNDLQHPNEFIRGVSLRFLCKLKQIELLEPCIPTIKVNLSHRHPFVRKNAVLALACVFQFQEHLVPDAPELIYSLLKTESDSNARRNAFLMLSSINQQLAVDYLNSVWSTIPSQFDDLLQIAAIQLIRKDCSSPQADKPKYIQLIFSLMSSPSHTVKYEAANTLVSLSSHSSAVRGAASCYIDLVLAESDNNVKLIVLKRLSDLRQNHKNLINDLAMDVLRVLSSPDITVRKTLLSIALDMVDTRNVDQVVGILTKELLKTRHQDDYEKNLEYRQLLVQTIHSCAIKFSLVAANVVHVLMEFIGDSGSTSAVDVVSFVRQVMEKFPLLRHGILTRLNENLAEMKTGRVFRGAFWIIGEYSDTQEMIVDAFQAILKVIGDIPIIDQSPSQVEAVAPKHQPISRVNADGTYATETAFTKRPSKAEIIESKPQLRQLLLGGDFYLGSVLSTCLTKLVSRLDKVSTNKSTVNEFKAQAMLIMTSIIRLGKTDLNSKIDEDSHDRILLNLRVISTNNSSMKEIFLVDCRNAYKQLIETENIDLIKKSNIDKLKVSGQVDDLVSFRHLTFKKALGGGADTFDMDLTRATGTTATQDENINKLNRIIQLTGFSDAVYAEAYVNVHQYDILLDVLVVNQTNETMQNLTLEFSTLGDLKLVERPAPYTLRAHGFHTIKANIKVSSTETGVIFGNIVYDGTGASDMSCIILNDIHIDIMDYINPATCTESQFRSMWLEFEWENKINVNTNIKDLREYLAHILKSTNMNCLTPAHALSGECGILAGNLYAKSIFGEDALANICLELNGTDISGHIRIRSKTQGIALSLGDKITVCQKIAIAAE